jgi:hypothetical protein
MVKRLFYPFATVYGRRISSLPIGNRTVSGRCSASRTRSVPCLRQGRELQRDAKLCKSLMFILQSNRYFSIILFEIRRWCLLVHAASEFNDGITKTTQGHLNEKMSYGEIVEEFSGLKARKANVQSLKLNTVIITYKYKPRTWKN